MWWRRLFLSHSLNVRWKEAMFLSNLSECLPKNSLTSSMVFKEKVSEGVEGSSEKETESQDDWSFHCFLAGEVPHPLPCFPRVWAPPSREKRRMNLFQDIAQGQPSYRTTQGSESLVLLRPFSGTKPGLSGILGMTCVALVKKPWFLIIKPQTAFGKLLPQFPGAAEELLFIKNNEISKRLHSGAGW